MPNRPINPRRPGVRPPTGKSDERALLGYSATDFVETPSGLWMPAASVHADVFDTEPLALRYAMITAGWSDLSGRQPTLDEIVDRLQRYSLRQIVQAISRINLTLERGAEPGEHPDRQRFILERVVHPDSARRIVGAVQRARGADYDGERTVYFSERQTLNALKIALLTVDAGAPDSAEGLGALVEALLMLNDYLDREFEGRDSTTAEGMAQMELYIFANMTLNDGGLALQDFVRSQFMYGEQHPELDEGAQVVDMPASLARSAGLPASTLRHALFALLAAWGSRTPAEIDAGAVGIARTRYFSTLPALTEQDSHAWFALGAQDIADLQQRVRGQYDLASINSFDLLEFERAPLVSFGETTHCVSLRLLERLGRGSLQHRLLDPTVFSSRERAAFLAARGKVAELYVGKMLERMFNVRHLSEKVLEPHAHGRPVCDAVVPYGDAALLIEVKVVHVPVKPRHALDYGQYQKTWGRHVIAAADQIESVATLIDDGSFDELGVHAAAIAQVVPVIVVFEQLVTPLTYRRLVERDLARHPLLRRIASGAALPITMLHIRDLEILEVAVERGYSVLDILRAKASDQETAALSVLNYLHLTDHPALRGTSTWHQARYDAMMEETRRFLRSLGMSDGDAHGDVP